MEIKKLNPFIPTIRVIRGSLETVFPFHCGFNTNRRSKIYSLLKTDRYNDPSLEILVGMAVTSKKSPKLLR